MLKRITPLILTYNESPNIARTLARLSWAQTIIIVDSFSDDDTLQKAREFPQTLIFQRQFDCHQNQWNFALKETGIISEWVLALDADYVLTTELVEEMAQLDPPSEVCSYVAKFKYCINGQPLRGSAYPPARVLYRRKNAVYRQDGHTQRIVVEGKSLNLRSPIMHDDRKSLSHWLRSQDRYMSLESDKLLNAHWTALGWADRLRKMRLIAPFVIFLYCLIIKRSILDGRPGLYYAFQRMLAELLLSIYLLQPELKQMGENPTS